MIAGRLPVTAAISQPKNVKNGRQAAISALSKIGIQAATSWITVKIISTGKKQLLLE
jgi:hypothetical protein